MEPTDVREGRQRVKEGASWPHISVVIATRDRPDDLRRCLASLCGVRYPNWDVLIINQGDGDVVRAIVQEHAASVPAVVQLDSKERGLSRARNQALLRAPGEILAFIDDDCTVMSSWLRDLAGVFLRHADAGLVFGSVDQAAHDSAEFVIPGHTFTGEDVVRSGRRALESEGMGAGMALRPALLAHVAPFDEELGAGTPFPSGEETDYCFRAVYAGVDVVTTGTVQVTHHGKRSIVSGDATRLMRGSGVGAGAMHMKLVRCGHLIALTVIASHIMLGIRSIDWRAVRERRGKSHAGWLVAYVTGLIASFSRPVQRQRCLYARYARLARRGR